MAWPLCSRSAPTRWSWSGGEVQQAAVEFHSKPNMSKLIVHSPRHVATLYAIRVSLFATFYGYSLLFRLDLEYSFNHVVRYILCVCYCCFQYS